MHRDGTAPFDFLHPRLPEGHPLREHVTYRLSRTEWQGRPTKTRTLSRLSGKLGRGPQP
jgi:hypothetical protein